jgi:hypothetical protein
MGFLNQHACEAKNPQDLFFFKLKKKWIGKPFSHREKGIFFIYIFLYIFLYIIYIYIYISKG